MTIRSHNRRALCLIGYGRDDGARMPAKTTERNSHIRNELAQHDAESAQPWYDDSDIAETARARDFPCCHWFQEYSDD